VGFDEKGGRAITDGEVDQSKEGGGETPDACVLARPELGREVGLRVGGGGRLGSFLNKTRKRGSGQSVEDGLTEMIRGGQGKKRIPSAGRSSAGVRSGAKKWCSKGEARTGALKEAVLNQEIGGGGVAEGTGNAGTRPQSQFYLRIKEGNDEGGD